MATPAPAPRTIAPAVRATVSRHRRGVRLIAVASAIVLAGSVMQASVPSLSASSSRPVPAAPVAAISAAQPAGPTPGQPRLRADPLERLVAAVTAGGARPQPLGPPARVVYRVKTSQKVVALTFDDGWSPAAGRLIVDTLLREHVAATFFVNARYVHWDPALWRTIGASGFAVGNHTYDHRDLTTMSATAIAADLAKDADVFRQLTGYAMAPIVRPPYGAHNRRVDAAIRAAGYSTEILWDVVAGDTSASRSDAALIASAIQGRAGSIVLMHMGPSSTPRILAAVIASYRARGFRFVTIPELLALGG
ncbi:MAG: polysaccharide deacetylase family protein [Chloroflexi bacterium]|nr:polysaccharide deacetylase family protein [Chloroflexota bacterium]